MRKLVALVAASTVGVTAAVAVAQSSQTNVYKVSGKAVPAKSASKKKPIPVKLIGGWDVSEQSGLRPAVVNTYSIIFEGGTANTEFFPKCTAQQINDAQSDSVCPKGSQVGTSKINAVVGATNNPSDTSIKCDTTGDIYNSGGGRAAIFIEGNPPACATPLATAIDAKFVKGFGGRGTGLEFTVPENLRHPVPGLDLAVTKVSFQLDKRITKVGGKKRGMFEINQKCPKSHKAGIEFVFTPEQGAPVKETITQPCK
ncbi:MAG TPA: hypothetical protein VFR97_01115 [Capillimicrobium sp.]|nr:hypothetical protein [Capillimicrobium sp.]